MHFIIFCVIYSCVFVASSFSEEIGLNVTDKFNSANFANIRKFDLFGKKRGARFISFDSSQGDISIELAFNVPFIQIPVRKAMDNISKGLPLVNVNIGALFLAGGISIASLIIVPTVLGFMAPVKYPAKSKFRALDEPNTWQTIMAVVDDTLLQSDINSTSCFQRLLCKSVQKSSQNVAAGQGNSSDKIIDGLASNSLVNHLVNGTMAQEALFVGYRGDNCSQIFPYCKLTKTKLQNLASSFLPQPKIY